MNIDDILIALEDRVLEMSNDELVNLWNSIFPVEEKISKKDLTGSKTLSEEVSMMIVDEVSTFGTKKLLRVYNKIMNDNLALEDLDREEISEAEIS
jgi:hypothetical protein